jgi:uncharacterized protein YdeI (YjbR/CyaY-like superfamily)
MEFKNGIKTCIAANRNQWRGWLEENHQSEKSVWLIIYRKESSMPSITYPEAVDEALCFGWIDSKPNKRDEHSFYQYFAKRNPKSNWSKVNKEKVAVLMAQNKIHPSGLEMIEIAKRNGTWNALDSVDNIEVPDDLQEAFDQNILAKNYWSDFPRSAKRAILEWILNAKKPETRLRRIAETVEKASKNIRATQGN